MYSKRQNAIRIQNSFRGKSAVRFEERKYMAENFYANLDLMLTEPSEAGFVELVNNVNMLVNLIYATNTRKNRRKIGKVPDIHFWLVERHDSVAPVINKAHDRLMAIEKRWNKYRSYTLDAETIKIMEQVIEMLEQAISVTPLSLLVWVQQQCYGIHKRRDDGFFHIIHQVLDTDYIIKEEIWNESADCEQ